jgi:hypothetical protein
VTGGWRELQNEGLQDDEIRGTCNARGKNEKYTKNKI